MRIARRHRPSISAFSILCGLVLFLYVLSFFGLFFYGLTTSLKDPLEFYLDPVSFPKKLFFSNYTAVFKNFKMTPGAVTGRTYYIEEMFLFSLIYAAGCSICNVIVCSATAYVCAKFDYRFSKVVSAIVLFTMIFPVIGSLPSEMQMVRRLGLYDTFIGNFFLKASFPNLYYLVFYAAFRSVPKDFIEAAEMDGANNLVVMFRIMYPMVISTMFTVWLIYFIQYWNDYQTPLLYLPSKPTISLGLLSFSFNTSFEIAGEPVKIAACLTVFIPILVIFIAFQKRLMGNVSMGGIKG